MYRFITFLMFRMGLAHEVGSVVAFLVSEAASYPTGVTIAATGGIIEIADT